MKAKSKLRAQASLFDELIVDNFAGGGGASVGIELATGRPVDIAINHDPAAVLMHKANHPYTRHYREDVWKINPREICGGKPVALAWFSPDCKHFSKAKGGKPRSKKIRGLAWVAVKWAATVHPRVIILENVEEFQTWGPLDRNGQPVKEQAGRTFRSFVNALCYLGYKLEHRELRACDYGAPTIRKRLFLIARNDDRPIVWPEPTHGDPESAEVKTGKLKPWRTAEEIINWSLPCPSIFDSVDEIKAKYGLHAVRPLATNTMKRVARGIDKFVLKNPQPFIVNLNHTSNRTAYDCFRGQSITEPFGTLTASNGFGVAAPSLIQYHSEAQPGEVRGQRANEVLRTVDASNRYGITTAFLQKYYSGGYRGSGNAPTSPLSTVTAADHNALVTSQLVQFNNHCIGQSETEPLNTVTAGQGHFGESRALLVKYYGTGDGQRIERPLGTVTARDRFGLVLLKTEKLEPGTPCGHWKEIRSMLNRYCGYKLRGDEILVYAIGGAEYIIVDIGLRMLTPRELFAAQGFPPDYTIDVDCEGNAYPKSEQVARCGNAVPPPFAVALVRANLPDLCVRHCHTMAELRETMAV